jgi:hypothetical protein
MLPAPDGGGDGVTTDFEPPVFRERVLTVEEQAARIRWCIANDAENRRTGEYPEGMECTLEVNTPFWEYLQTDGADILEWCPVREDPNLLPGRIMLRVTTAEYRVKLAAGRTCAN